MKNYIFKNATVLTSEGLIEKSIAVSNGIIVERPITNSKLIDGRGLLLAPALIDIHGDAFERSYMPRPNVFFPITTALIDIDRQLALNGITTAFHALTLSWEPGLRSLENGKNFIENLLQLEQQMRIDHKVQLRWETFAEHAVSFIKGIIKKRPDYTLAFNDHTSMKMRAFDVNIKDREFEHSPDFRVASLSDARMKERNEANAKRSGLSTEEYILKLESVWNTKDQVMKNIESLSIEGRKWGIAMLSHDDTKIETRDFYNNLGISICEFPMTHEVASHARKNNAHIVFGAPNVLRGGSHIGSPSAADMIEMGLCDILASDYAYSSMLSALKKLESERNMSLTEIWKQVSLNPAKTLNLHDRGEISKGKRADLVLLDWFKPQAPEVILTMSAGRIAYLNSDIVLP